jgi:hypothetical protein
MRTPRDRPGLDEKPLPHYAKTRQIEHCPCCGDWGLLYVFKMPGLPEQVHCVHRPVQCETCHQRHPVRVCVLPTWPASKGMSQQILMCKPAPPPPV